MLRCVAMLWGKKKRKKEKTLPYFQLDESVDSRVMATQIARTEITTYS